jgi:hypothetical protein
MKTLFFLFMSIVAFAQKDTTIITKKVIVLDSVFYVQTITRTISHEALNTALLQKTEKIEQEELRKLEENKKSRAERREIVKLVQEALKQGYVPKSENSYDKSINSRIINKIKKEKL